MGDVLHFYRLKRSKRIEIRLTNEKRKGLNYNDKLDLSIFIFEVKVFTADLSNTESKELFSIALGKLNVKYSSTLAETVSFL